MGKCLLAAGLMLVCVGPLSAQEAAETTLRGRVLEAVTRDAVPGAAVRTEGARTVTGDDGTFALNLAKGTWVVTITATGYVEEAATVTITDEVLAPLEVLLYWQFSELVEVRAPRPRRQEPSAAELEPALVLGVAGSLDNIFRTVQTLPGVAATDDFGSRLSVRGGEPDQNLTMMDGVEIHNPYRLFGLTSAFNPETVDFFELTAGGFSAKYGDRLSSILIVENRPGNRERRVAGSVAASLTDANVILEGALPGSGEGSWLLTARRTYYDLVVDRITDSNFPSFGDLQAKVDVGVGRSGALSFFGLRSREDTNFDIEDENEPDDFVRLINKAGNDLVSAAYDTILGARGGSQTVLSWYRNTDFLDFDGQFRDESKRSNAPGDEAFGTSQVLFNRRLSVEDLALRQGFSYFAGDRHFMETGLDFHALDTALEFESLGTRNNQEANGSSVRGGAGLPDALQSVLPANRFGFWVQDHFLVIPRWTITPGIRFDWSDVNARTTWSPRLATTYQIDPSTRIRGAAGLYTQSPGYEKLIQSDFFIDLTDAAALDLGHERSMHYIAGLERDLAPGLSVRVEAFYKTFDDLIVGRLETEEERFARIARYDFPPELQDQIPTSPIITTNGSNDARGSAYGFDVFLAKRATSRESRLSGWLSYTWSRGERDAYGRIYPFDYDRRHALNLVGSYRLAEKWALAVTGRLASGFPYTPALGVRVAATEDPNDPERLIPDTDASGLLMYEAGLGDTNNLNTGRLPLYMRFDIRVSWRPGGDMGNFELYFEVINAFKRDNAIHIQNQLEYDPNADIPRIVENPGEGFPLLPSFGIRWHF